MSIKETTQFPLRCPSCSAVTRKTLAWLELNDRLNCPVCDTEFPTPPTKSTQTLDQLRQELDELLKLAGRSLE